MNRFRHCRILGHGHDWRTGGSTPFLALEYLGQQGDIFNCFLLAATDTGRLFLIRRILVRLQNAKVKHESKKVFDSGVTDALAG